MVVLFILYHKHEHTHTYIQVYNVIYIDIQVLNLMLIYNVVYIIYLYI